MRDDDREPRAGTACARMAARVRCLPASGPAPPAAPLPPSGFAVAGPGNAGHGEGRAGRPTRPPGQLRRDAMSAAADAELDLFRRTVNCAAVLERMMGGWRLDLRESTRRALKYRRGAGEIIIVNHDGRGWWDATGHARRRVHPRPASRTKAQLRRGLPDAAALRGGGPDLPGRSAGAPSTSLLQPGRT